MKVISLTLACLILLALECALLRPLGWSVARFDVSVALVVFLALNCQTLEGAFGSFAAGYMLDAVSGLPSGLYVFTAVLTFLLARLVSPFVEVRGPVSFAALAAGMDALHNLAAWGLVLLGSDEGIDRSAMLGGVLPSAALTALVAPLLWLVLRRIEASFEKPETGLL
jgi:hypothetical protein